MINKKELITKLEDLKKTINLFNENNKQNNRNIKYS